MNVGTHHSATDAGIKVSGAPQQRGAQSLGRAGRSMIENQNSAHAKPPAASGTVAKINNGNVEESAQEKKENQIVLDAALLDNLSNADLKRSYIMLGKEFKNKVNTVNALQRNFAVVSKLCQTEQEEKEKVL